MNKAQQGHYQDTAQTSIQQGGATTVLRGSPSYDRCIVGLRLKDNGMVCLKLNSLEEEI